MTYHHAQWVDIGSMVDATEDSAELDKDGEPEIRLVPPSKSVRRSRTGATVVSVVLGTVALISYGQLRNSGRETHAAEVAQQVRSIERSVVFDAIAQFRTAQRAGDKVDVCVHAGLVTASLIQAKESLALSKWKPIEAFYCARAGLAVDGAMEGAGTPCTVPQRGRDEGVCMTAASCGEGFSSHPGRCPGPSTIRCCVPDGSITF